MVQLLDGGLVASRGRGLLGLTLASLVKSPVLLHDGHVEIRVAEIFRGRFIGQVRI